MNILPNCHIGIRLSLLQRKKNIWALWSLFGQMFRQSLQIVSDGAVCFANGHTFRYNQLIINMSSAFQRGRVLTENQINQR